MLKRIALAALLVAVILILEKIAAPTWVKTLLTVALVVLFLATNSRFWEPSAGRTLYQETHVVSTLFYCPQCHRLVRNEVRITIEARDPMELKFKSLTFLPSAKITGRRLHDEVHRGPLLN
ncbi:hypothetical protein A2716_01550 [candidate division WWE3 bacterium RIFCSPHIGHO2_01_FULL_40_23]|uniref:Uncharacterized protein n=1 Tax=candidate division WWE3 bacterium RIFCSPLOWO2_01_FULL_41_18 TaxID=1802625 RepID=A0A1F4VEK6_UNCKA|nr:MAG: hypothetical protein A2716_01550 [candidate division WWE3 bacterium RIFCSPHIGHO2_01_FULL_40_23]OGC55681.1 MAG: hypothetical protein A3A78_01400 [candidate division WWE3 bacterium RIFCSPLOWO2_01_FULL_41_18]